jgi:predicted  nucleic acid-binding Zn-ribbon protein
LVGEPVVDIEPGSPSAPAMRAGDTLRVSQSGTLEGVMDKAQSLTLDFDKLVLDMQSFQNGAQRGSERLARLQNNLMAVSGEFRDFSRSLTDSPAHDASTRVQAALKHMQAQNQQLRVALHDAMQRAQSTRADVQPALHRLMARSDTISQLIASLRQQMTQGGGGLLVRAQKDSAIVKALHEATRQLDSLMTETKRNPLRFWF